MTKFLFSLAMLCVSLNLFGTHTTQAHFRYTYLKTLGNGDRQYRITLHCSRDCKPGSVAFSDSAWFGIYSRDNGKVYKSMHVIANGRNKHSNCYGQCIEDIVYEGTIDIKPNNNGYYVTNEMCCRIEGTNLRNNQNGQPDIGTTAISYIPSLVSNSNAGCSVDLIFANPAKSDTTFFDIVDLEKDSIAIELVGPKIGSSISNSYPEPHQNFTTPENIDPSRYEAGYSSAFPLGINSVFKLGQDNRSFIVQCTKPGAYFVAFQVSEFRNGVLVGQTTWETIVYVEQNMATDKFHLTAWGEGGPLAIMNWDYCSENSRFQTVQRSTDNMNFDSINQLGYYQKFFVDENVSWNTVYYYRIKLAQANNRIRYSDTAIVRFWNTGVESQFSGRDITVSPMPVIGTLQVSSETVFSAYAIVDHTGRVILQMELREEKRNFEVDCAAWPSGIYFIQCTTSNGEQVYKKLIKL